METARSWSVPPSVLMGRVPQPGEPTWTQRDADLAVALTALEADREPGCGHPRSESMDPEREFDWVAEPVRCHACAARDRAARAAHADGTWSDAGVKWITRLRG